jgi:hypothetical protein
MRQKMEDDTFALSPLEPKLDLFRVVEVHRAKHGAGLSKHRVE